MTSNFVFCDADAVPAEPIALTLEACKEYVHIKIRRGRMVRREKMQNVLQMESDLKLDIAAMKIQELRVEHFTKQYELGVQVSKHHRGPNAIPVLTREEREALQLKTLVERLCCDAWMSTRTLTLKIRRVKTELQTLERIMAVWEAGIESHAERMFKELMREDIPEEAAFQEAGLECRCSDVNCDFPYTIDDEHRHL